MTDISTSPSATNSAQSTVRRIIVYALLFALVIVAAIGVSGLVGRLLSTEEALAGDRFGGLAESLAFTLVGGPFAAFVWRLSWKRLDDPVERASIAWGLYVAAMSTLSLIVFVSGFLITAAALIEGRWEPRDLANGIVWLGIWTWHHWMGRHAAASPTRLTSLPTVAGWVFGLVIGVGGAVSALGDLLDAAIGALSEQFAVGQPWWVATLQSIVWTVGGALVWWWHWVRGGRGAGSALTSVAIVVAGILGATVLTLGGVGTTIFIALRLAFDRTESLAELSSALDAAMASAAVGALVWAYYRGVARERSATTREATRLVVSGVALAAAATGVGVSVNAMLAALAPSIAGSDARTLLLGGFSALIVGGPLWWTTWRPRQRAEPSRAASIGRRVYLVAVFGLSAIVALITLLVIGFRVFEFLLEGLTGASLVERIRAPLGLLTATVLVAGYHFGVWRRDRAATAAAAPAARPRTIGHVVLVTGPGSEAQVETIGALTGAKVTVWLRATRDVAPGGPDDEQLALALDGIVVNRALVVIGPGDRVEVVPLAD